MMAAFEGKKPEPVQETKPVVVKKPVQEPKAETKQVEEEKQAPPKSAR